MDDRDTDPQGLTLTHDDILAYLMGSMQRIESQMADILAMTQRVVDIECKQHQMEKNCHRNHGNGKAHL